MYRNISRDATLGKSINLFYNIWMYGSTLYLYQIFIKIDQHGWNKNAFLDIVRDISYSGSIVSKISSPLLSLNL